ncbi:calcium-binding protein [Fusibacter sp. JL216-2]|uniref:calcium-binding protein n=1 Tax=Fusibacter sp. JL216-2 TaxID=3071453 RepID=UPI003D335ABF
MGGDDVLKVDKDLMHMYSDQDKLVFCDYNLSDLTFKTDTTSDDLILEIESCSDKITIQDGLTSSYRQIEEFEFQDNTVRSVDVLIQAMNKYSEKKVYS